MIFHRVEITEIIYRYLYPDSLFKMKTNSEMRKSKCVFEKLSRLSLGKYV